MIEAQARAIIVGPDAAALRRAIGPTPWAALEIALSVAQTSGAELVAAVSARQLAEALGLAKGTAARALLVLRRAGLLTARQSRAGNGEFACGHYAIDVPSHVLAFNETTHPTTAAHRLRRFASVPVEQLSLLPN